MGAASLTLLQAGLAMAQEQPKLPPLPRNFPMMVGNMIVLPHASETLEHVSGLASNSVLDSTTFKPRRVSDQRAVTAAGAKAIYSVSPQSLIDFDYNLQSINYLDHDEFNFLTNAFSAGMRHEVDIYNAFSFNTGLTRAHATGDYTGYYWRPHVNVAYTRRFDMQTTLSTSLDLAKYNFDKSENLDSNMFSLSVTPRHRLTDLPLEAAFTLSLGRNNARIAAQTFQFAEASPSLTWKLNAQESIQGSLRYARYDFAGPDLVQTAITRDDRIWGGSVGYYRQLTQDVVRGLTAFARYSHTNTDSNIDRQSYDSHVVSVGLSARF